MNRSNHTDLDRLNPFGDASGLSTQIGDTALTHSERRKISQRLGANLLGAGLLGVGLYIENSSPGQAEIGQLIQAVAALVVSVSIFQRALIGFFGKPPRNFTEQLVGLAVLAAMAAGDFVSAALVPLLLEIGHLFEERSALGAQASIKRLRELCARSAVVLIDGQEREIPSEEVTPGAQLIVRPGEVIVADGVVDSGHANIDQSPVTGESTPKGVDPGDTVYAGTVNLDGVLRVSVETAGSGTVLGEVIRVLQEVESTKTPIVRMLEKAASIYLPLVVTIAAVVLVLTGDLSRFVTVLIVACPCALVLAAPAAMVAAMSSATKESILIKNAAFLETVALVNTLVLDKTGTVTEGSQSVDGVRAVSSLSENDVLQLAAAAAHGSRHPASRAIISEATKVGLSIPGASRFHEASGRGVQATLQTDTIRIGRASWLQECGVAGVAEDSRAGVWVAKNNQAVGFISLFDQARSDAANMISHMRELGFDRIVLLTGDKSEVATRVAQELRLDEVFAEVLPAEKLEIVRREQDAGGRVLMVGDGINDALALSAADVGIAVGAEMNDVALGGADVALLSNDLTRLPYTVRLADRTRQVIFENVVIGLAFSVGMLGLASFGLINPLAGALFHNAGAIFVVFNSSRLLEREKADEFTSTGNSIEAEPGDSGATLPQRRQPLRKGRTTTPRDTSDTKLKGVL